MSVTLKGKVKSGSKAPKSSPPKLGGVPAAAKSAARKVTKAITGKKK